MKTSTRCAAALTSIALACAGSLLGLAPSAQAAPYNGPVTRIADLNPGSGSFTVASGNPVTLGGKLYFTGGIGNDQELWVTDGTTAGTKRVVDLVPGADGSGPQQLTVMGGRLYFFAYTPATGQELFTSDGTAAGTSVVRDYNGADKGVSAGFGLRTLVASGNHLFYAGYDGPTNAEPWISDGTPGGTRKLKEVNTDPGPTGGSAIGSGPQLFTALAGGAVAFSAFDAGGRTDLWVSDGTDPGTRKIAINPVGSSNPNEIFAFGNGALINASGVGNDTDSPSRKDYELWRLTDVTDNAATLVKNIDPNTAGGGANIIPNSGQPVNFTLYQGNAYFVATTTDRGREVWTTDGTTGGTRQLPDVGLGNGVGANISARPTPALGELYFGAGAQVAQSGEELYAWNGSTQRVVDALPGMAGASPEDDFSATRPGIVPVANQIAFIGHVSQTPATNNELWASDGTAAGTRQLAELNPANASAGAITILGVLGNTLIFVGNDGQSGNELYSVDFTQPAAPAPTPQPTPKPVPVKSTTTLAAKKTYSLVNAKKKKISVAIAVSAPGLTPTGTVSVTEKGKSIGTGVLASGSAQVKIKKKLEAGKHKLVATYAGSALALASSSATVKITVKAKKRN